MNPDTKKRILIAGGTGLIGRRLSQLLKENGYSVSILTRNKDAKSPESYYWNYREGVLDGSAVENIFAVIHLAGANVGDRSWSKKRKQEIIDSRVLTTNLLLQRITEAKIKPDLFLSASAVGYYGNRGDEVLTESAGPGEGFLSTTVAIWEESVQKATALDLRTVILRTGVVLDPQEGALPKMAGPVKAFVGSALGNGKQYFPWIHLEDICRMYLYVLENETIHGVFNAVAPGEETNHSFTKKLGKALRRPVFLPPVPAPLLKLILGEMAHLVLDSTRVSAKKILNTGFAFQYPEAGPALEQLYR